MGFAKGFATCARGATGSLVLLPDTVDDDFFLVKTDSAGNMEWNKTYGRWECEYLIKDLAYSVVQTSPDGGYAIAGETISIDVSGISPTAVDYDFWLVKTDADGNLQWDRAYGAGDYAKAYSVVQTVDGGYALAGCIGYPNIYDFWLVKTDAFGLTEEHACIEVGLAITGWTADTLELYRGAIDPYWNYVRVRMWVLKETP